ncbi:MAG: DUF5693 family protein [Bacillota bacterium]|nr:DUF5693 family protein [Bacillota bacterium]
MNKKLIYGLWVLLIVCLAFSFSGISLRVSNEAQNKTLVTTADFYQFEKTADLANEDIDDVLTRLQEAGVKNLSVKELTLRYLAYKGDIQVAPYNEFAATMQNASPSLWSKIRKAVGDRAVRPVNLTVVTDQSDVADLLEERLGDRFSSDEMIHFGIDGKDYFILTAELSEIVKNKNGNLNLDNRLGFDNELLSKLRSRSFDVTLRPGTSAGSKLTYMHEYEEAVRDYDVQTLIFDGTILPGVPDDVETIEQIVTDQELLVGIIETSVQLQYIDQQGLDQLMLDTNYPINRVYSTGNDEYLTQIDERYYRWIRSVIDRGIRILYLAPFKDGKLSASDNLNNTIMTVDHFHSTIQQRGFTLHEPLPRLSSMMTETFHRFAVCLSLLLAAMLYLIYLFKPGRRLIYILLGLGILGCAGINLLLNMDFSKIYALGAAILYPSFSSLLLLLYLKKSRQPFPVQILASLSILIGINMLGAYTIVTSLSDIRYIMNIGIFSGVKLSFVLPLILFVVNYLAVFMDWQEIRDKTVEFLHRSPSYLALVIGIVALGILYYYLGRSGHTAGIKVSSLEIKLREVLENLFLARPRFKEFLIGYPALFAMVYLYHKYKHPLILMVLGLGVVMGSISMVNSFSHVFTAVTISASRGLAGLFTGVLLAIVGLIGIRIIEWVWEKYARN